MLLHSLFGTMSAGVREEEEGPPVLGKLHAEHGLRVFVDGKWCPVKLRDVPESQEQPKPPTPPQEPSPRPPEPSPTPPEHNIWFEEGGFNEELRRDSMMFHQQRQQARAQQAQAQQARAEQAREEERDQGSEITFAVSDITTD